MYKMAEIPAKTIHIFVYMDPGSFHSAHPETAELDVVKAIINLVISSVFFQILITLLHHNSTLYVLSYASNILSQIISLESKHIFI
jgi:hypothetical protein